MRRKKALFLVLFDIALIIYSYILAIFLRFDGQIPRDLLNIKIHNVIIIIGIKIGVYYLFKLYRSIWKYASIDELMGIIGAVLLANIITSTYMYTTDILYPMSLSFIVPILDIALIGGSRFLFRVIRRLSINSKSSKNSKKVIIVGAGAAGVMTLKELRNHRQLYSKPLAFIDDDLAKKGKIINRVPVLGNRDDIKKICKNMISMR